MYADHFEKRQITYEVSDKLWAAIVDWRAVEIYMRQYPNDEIVRVASTEFFSELLTWFNHAGAQFCGKDEVSSHGKRKLNVLVGHTENIAKLVLALELDPTKYHNHPYYASNFMFELYHNSSIPFQKGQFNKDEYYVMIKYNDEIVHVGKEGVCQQNGACPLDKFEAYINTRIWTKTSLFDYCNQKAPSSQLLFQT